MCVEAAGWRKRRDCSGSAGRLFIAGLVRRICTRNLPKSAGGSWIRGGLAARTGGAFWRDDQGDPGGAEEIGHHQKNRPGMVKVVATKELHFCASCAPGLPGIAGKTSFILMRAVSRPVFTGRMAGRLGAPGLWYNHRPQPSTNQSHHGTAGPSLDRPDAVWDKLHPSAGDSMDKGHALAHAQAAKPDRHGQRALS